MNPDTYKKELAQLQEKLQDPDVYSRKDYPQTAKRASELEDIVLTFDRIKEIETEIENNLKDTDTEPELKELAYEINKSYQEELQVKKDYLSDILMPKDPNDAKNCIIEMRAGAGGDEASLFVAELYRAYVKYAETNSFKIELISESPSEVGGFKEIVFNVRGVDAYKTFHLEAGVHRVQRVPATESQGRIHTSTITVAVLPEAEENDIEINPSDLRIDVYHASGHGGQSVNTTDSAVRITHIPTGVVVTQQDEKSQTKNKAKAMGVLRSRLLQAQIESEQAKMSAQRQKLIGSGDRSEKIRTYNFPQDRITDHRIGYSRSNIPGAMAGQIDDLIEELQKAEHEILAAGE